MLDRRLHYCSWNGTNQCAGASIISDGHNKPSVHRRRLILYSLAKEGSRRRRRRYVRYWVFWLRFEQKRQRDEESWMDRRIPFSEGGSEALSHPSATQFHGLCCAWLWFWIKTPRKETYNIGHKGERHPIAFDWAGSVVRDWWVSFPSVFFFLKISFIEIHGGSAIGGIESVAITMLPFMFHRNAK